LNLNISKFSIALYIEAVCDGAAFGKELTISIKELQDDSNSGIYSKEDLHKKHAETIDKVAKYVKKGIKKCAKHITIDGSNVEVIISEN